MSLFGGDSSAPPTESEYGSASANSPSPVAQSPPRSSLRGPQSAPTVSTAHGAHDPAIQQVAQHLDGNDADSEEPGDHEQERPNRFKGPPQTWKGYTAADRQIAESLQQLQDTDLAAHLYNAHALKRRVRKPATELSTLSNWQSKDAWLKEGKDVQYTDTAAQLQTELVPTKDWTAWPLPPASLCTLSDGFRRAAVAPEENEWAIAGIGAHAPGEELKEEMLSVFLRLANDSWNKKDWQDEGRLCAKKRARLRARAKSQSVQSHVDMKDGSGAESSHGQGEVAQEIRGKRGRKPQSELTTKPAILADDAKAHRLLQPTISSMLDKLDDVALALQRTRLNHFGRGRFGEGSSQSEWTTDAETTERDSRSRSQSRRKSAPRSKPVTRQSSRPSSSRVSRAPKSMKKPPQSEVEPEDSDSASDYGARFGNKDGSEPGALRSPTLRRKRSKSESTMDEDDVSNIRDWSRTGLMDWSEVLGVAAVKGWNQQALARTTQRCSALFGENMSFMLFDEGLATKPANLVHYKPSTIPAPSDSVDIAPRSTKRPYFQPGAIRCPHTDCYGHHKDFAMSYRVIEHCMRIHGYDPRSNDSDNEERTHGGVHIDGFLQPITAKQGWLGHGRSKAGGKKRKTEGADPAGSTTVAAASAEEI